MQFYLLDLETFTPFDDIGGVSEQSGKPGSITRTSGEELTAELDTGIQSYDNVETENGRLKIEFVDETQISLTEHTLS